MEETFEHITKCLNDIDINAQNIKKLSKKQLEVDTIFKPDVNGISKWIHKDEIEKSALLGWGNNGVARHGIFFNDNRYVWEKIPTKGKIKQLRTNGYSDLKLNKNHRPIRKDIDAYHKQFPCVVCGSTSDLVTDHKNDLYNDQRVLDINTQTKDDFQCLCNHCNLLKRQVIKKTKEIGKRYGATNIPSLAVFKIDFTQGDETLNLEDVNALVGTYWYDPVEFMKQIKSHLSIK